MSSADEEYNELLIEGVAVDIFANDGSHGYINFVKTELSTCCLRMTEKKVSRSLFIPPPRYCINQWAIRRRRTAISFFARMKSANIFVPSRNANRSEALL